MIGNRRVMVSRFIFIPNSPFCSEFLLFSGLYIHNFCSGQCSLGISPQVKHQEPGLDGVQIHLSQHRPPRFVCEITSIFPINIFYEYRGLSYDRRTVYCIVNRYHLASQRTIFIDWNPMSQIKLHAGFTTGYPFGLCAGYSPKAAHQPHRSSANESETRLMDHHANAILSAIRQLSGNPL